MIREKGSKMKKASVAKDSNKKKRGSTLGDGRGEKRRTRWQRMRGFRVNDDRRGRCRRKGATEVRQEKAALERRGKVLRIKMTP